MCFFLIVAFYFTCCNILWSVVLLSTCTFSPVVFRCYLVTCCVIPKWIVLMFVHFVWCTKVIFYIFLSQQKPHTFKVTPLGTMSFWSNLTLSLSSSLPWQDKDSAAVLQKRTKLRVWANEKPHPYQRLSLSGLEWCCCATYTHPCSAIRESTTNPWVAR